MAAEVLFRRLYESLTVAEAGMERGVPVVTSETLSSAARIWSDTQGSGLNWMPYTQQFRRFITDD